MGKLAAAAMKDLCTGSDRSIAVRDLCLARREIIEGPDWPKKSEGIPADPYLPWLAAKLLHVAAAGELFIEDSNHVTLRVSTHIGDDAYWYIGQIVSMYDKEDVQRTSGPWLLWENYGVEVTPNRLEDNPWIEDYPLVKVANDDIVMFELFRLPRNRAELASEIDVAATMTDGGAECVIRLPLPVVIGE
ncbi:MAG: hypothetical protein D8M59_10720 [Planctomycetes bacterium]|nr:hypothetical protein [Planctomycetota bacterium]NOG55313.1 hypothetical protein [Planctomycetota bacterium]